MANQTWINLPVQNLSKSEAFFMQLGFSVSHGPGNSEDNVRVAMGDENVNVILFPQSTFQRFTGTKISDTTQGTEVLFTISADSKTEVDEMVTKVVEAGGLVFGKPADHGRMYGAAFADLDGHRWNILYMDMSKIPNA